MWTEAQIIQALTDYLQTEVGYQKPETMLTAETALLETGLLDSLTIFKLILFIEEKFFIKISLNDIVLENFTTLNAVTGLIQSYNQSISHEKAK